MLTESEQKEIRKTVQEHVNEQAACIEALKIVQRDRGWVSDEAILDMAGLLGMTTAEIESVATFYNLIFRKPVGRHVLLVCDSITCWATGQNSLIDHLYMKLGIGLGETTKDGRFTILPTACLGACDHAPAMIIDNVLYGDLNEQRIDEILERYT